VARRLSPVILAFKAFAPSPVCSPKGVSSESVIPAVVVVAAVLKLLLSCVESGWFMSSDNKGSSGDVAGPKADTTKIVDLASFRRKKDVDTELTRGGRNPLYVSHLTGKVSDSSQKQRPDAPDFGDRLQRIRSSLEKINRLMSELKRMSTDGEGEEGNGGTKSTKT